MAARVKKARKALDKAEALGPAGRIRARQMRAALRTAEKEKKRAAKRAETARMAAAELGEEGAPFKVCFLFL